MDLETLYEAIGFDGLLEEINAMLLQRWQRYAQASEPLVEAQNDLTREIARLKKARLPLPHDEYPAIRAKGILWYPDWANS
jgi:hypothetical protein